MNTSFIWKHMSDTRKRYFLRFGGRVLVLLACAALAILRPQTFDILDGMNFFSAMVCPPSDLSSIMSKAGAKTTAPSLRIARALFKSFFANFMIPTSYMNSSGSSS